MHDLTKNAHASCVRSVSHAPFYSWVYCPRPLQLGTVCLTLEHLILSTVLCAASGNISHICGVFLGSTKGKKAGREPMKKHTKTVKSEKQVTTVTAQRCLSTLSATPPSTARQSLHFWASGHKMCLHPQWHLGDKGTSQVWMPNLHRTTER